MIGFVIVSHSAKIAEGVCDLAAQIAQGRVALAPAGGTSDPLNPIGTDAFKVMAAIESVYSEDGVVVMTDLGSAELSAEMALELLDAEKRARVHLSRAPLVEGTVAAVSQAAAGAGVDEILGGTQPPAAIAAAEAEQRVTVPAGLGLHARPAAQLIRLARTFQAQVAVENVTAQTGPASALSMNGLLSLRARASHQLLIRAQGTEARAAVDRIAKHIAGLHGAPLSPPDPGPAQRSAGIPASAGIAIGPLFRLQRSHRKAEPKSVDDPEAELARLHSAIARALAETRKLHDETGIFDAQSLLLEDPEVIAKATQFVLQDRRDAEWAWQTAMGEIAARLESLPDPYLRARAADVADVAARVLRILSPAADTVMQPARAAILAAHDLTPSEIQNLDRARVLGLCLETGSASAHSIILARAMGIPAIVGVGPALSALPEGAAIAIDGETGELWISPSADRLADLDRRRAAWLLSHRAAQNARHAPARTRDGRQIRVLANISAVEEAAAALDYGAEGVGVLRTEFLFSGRIAPPDESEQAAAYAAIAETLGDRPLVIRTLDIGGDKSLPYVEIAEEANPFLGWRGIRLTLDRRDLLCTQLRAIERAARGHNVEILLPMISTLDELRTVKAMLAADLKLGVMIEVPAAVAIADPLAREAAFFSIGTNDLVQYAMAADRTNARVAKIADPLQPAILRMLRQTIDAARRAGIPVTLCGELAADTLATPLLLGLGLREFSVSAPLIPDLKSAIGRWTIPEAESIAGRALELDTSKAVREFLHSL